MMAKKSPITSEVEQWLKLNHKRHTHKEMAANIGCCIETVRRALVRLELEVVHGAKYQRRAIPKKWSRPCIICGCSKSRPRMQFKCNACHDRERDADKHMPSKRNVFITLPRIDVCLDKREKATGTKENSQLG